MSVKIRWLASYPKSGNTWMRIVIAHLRKKGGLQTINEIQSGVMASDRNWIDSALGFSTTDLTNAEIERFRPAAYRWSAARAEVGDIHKIHDACTKTDRGEWLVCPEVCGPSVYLLRNPLDVALSYAGHTGSAVDRMIEVMNAPRHQMSLSAVGGATAQVPQKMLTWSGHVESWVDNRLLDLLVIRYEDLLDDPRTWFAKALRHLEVEHSPEALDAAIERARFDRLHEEESSGSFKERSQKSERFFRKGIAGDWIENLTPEQIARIVETHGPVMQRFGYCDANGTPKIM